ncbi:MAG: hypothetical protein U0U70_10765 [Chitinophagaceae bacterium]
MIHNPPPLAEVRIVSDASFKLYEKTEFHWEEVKLLKQERLPITGEMVYGIVLIPYQSRYGISLPGL